MFLVNFIECRAIPGRFISTWVSVICSCSDSVCLLEREGGKVDGDGEWNLIMPYGLGSELKLSWSGRNKRVFTNDWRSGGILPESPFSPRPTQHLLPAGGKWKASIVAFDMDYKRQHAWCMKWVFLASSLFLCYSLACLCLGTSFSLIISLIYLFSFRFRLLKMIGTTGVQSHLLLVYGDRCHP